MGTCVHGMARPSLHVCARNGFLPISDSLVFVEPNALDVCAREGPFLLKNIAFYSKRRPLFLACVFAIVVLTACGADLGEAVLVRKRLLS